jgi:hypothetical protein
MNVWGTERPPGPLLWTRREGQSLFDQPSLGMEAPITASDTKEITDVIGER